MVLAFTAGIGEVDVAGGVRDDFCYGLGVRFQGSEPKRCRDLFRMFSGGNVELKSFISRLIIYPQTQ